MMIHLESLNYQMFMQFPELFKELNKVKKEGLFFNHYFSTATSTLMVIGDIMYGGKEQYEVCSSLDFIPTEYFYKESLFDELKSKGYQTGIFVYPEGGDRESAEKRHIAGFHNEMVLKEEYIDFLGAIDELITDEPFAVMACNYISNVTLNCYADKEHVLDGTDKWKRGYEYLDQCVGDIMQLLRDKNQLKNTIVILYGDHGDDFWGHGMHGGLVHAIEPFSQMIHLPFIMLDGDKKGLDEMLLCATDLRQMIMERLGFGDIQNQTKNKYIVARSAYAAQPVRKETFQKAYSITDGKFLMMVSCEGLALFDIEMDMSCHFNFLQLFELESGRIRYCNEQNQKYRFHYLDFMNEQEITRIRQISYFFRKKLYEEVLVLYRQAGRTEQEMIQEMNFDQIQNKNG